jgi:uncharacterized circularly permuted ATP-grasp superfamily protein
MRQRLVFQNRSTSLIVFAFLVIALVSLGSPTVQAMVNCRSLLETVSQSETQARSVIRNSSRQQGPSSDSKLRVSDLLSETASHDKHGIQVRNAEAGVLTLLPADHPYVDSAGKPRPEFAHIWEFLTSYSAETVARLQEAVTRVFEGFGMNFKNKKGKVFTPKVNLIPATIEKKQFDEIIKGIELTLNIKRKILQVFMSDPNAKPKAYGLKHVSKEEIKRLIHEMKSSPYFDPQTVNQNLHNYNFISVVGVDATFGQLAKHLAHIFEINAGTPSGMSNLTLIFEAIRRQAPEYYDVLLKGLSDNGAFSLLRKVMDDHGRALLEDGLSVEIGTGVFNGAHPDQAMISYFSGMPLVARSDLFIDRDGYVRLKTKIPIARSGYYRMGDGSRIKHVGSEDYKGYVQVWSIYSRAEEGVTLSESTTKDRAGLGLKMPNNVEINARLSKELGIDLVPGTVYRYTRGDKTKDFPEGAITGVEKDPHGKPLVEEYWDQFGTDPIMEIAGSGNHRGTSPPSFLDSIHGGKVYLSNFGSRLIDHKGILSIVTKEAEGLMQAKGIDPKKRLLRTPPEANIPEEIQHFYTHPELYVMKVPDESGGQGVRILPVATRAEQALAVADHKANPNRYVIQSLADFMSEIGVAKIDGDFRFVSKAFDARIFVFLDSKGRALADPWGVLVRVAKHLSLSTNTSQGADYGTLVVVDEAQIGNGQRGRGQRARHSLMPKGKISVLTESQKFFLTDYFISMNMLANGYGSKASRSDSAQGRMAFLLNAFVASKTAMSLLGPEYAFFVAPIEKEFILAQQRGDVSMASFDRLASLARQVQAMARAQAELLDSDPRAFPSVLGPEIRNLIGQEWDAYSRPARRGSRRNVQDSEHQESSSHQ